MEPSTEEQKPAPGYQPRPVPIETAREIVRLSEVHLEALLKLALAADSRATGLSGLLVSAAAGLIAGGFSLLFGKEQVTVLGIVLGSAALGAAIFFIAALWQAIAAARPKPFGIAGSDYDSWDTEEDKYGDLSDALMGQARNYQNKINKNRERLSEGAARISLALRLVAIAPIAAIAVGLTAYAVWMATQ